MKCYKLLVQLSQPPLNSVWNVQYDNFPKWVLWIRVFRNPVSNVSQNPWPLPPIPYLQKLRTMIFKFKKNKRSESYSMET